MRGNRRSIIAVAAMIFFAAVVIVAMGMFLFLRG